MFGGYLIAMQFQAAAIKSRLEQERIAMQFENDRLMFEEMERRSKNFGAIDVESHFIEDAPQIGSTTLLIGYENGEHHE